jgi:hypothetical protein
MVLAAFGKVCTRCSEVVRPASDLASTAAEQHQDQTDDKDDESQGPQDGDAAEEADQEQNETYDDHDYLLDARVYRRVS